MFDSRPFWTEVKLRRCNDLFYKHTVVEKVEASIFLFSVLRDILAIFSLSLSTYCLHILSDDGGDMKVWYHCQCIFETFKRARATTKKIETPADVEGFADLEDKEKDEIKELIKGIA